MGESYHGLLTFRLLQTVFPAVCNLGIEGSISDCASAERGKETAGYAEETTSRDDETNHERIERARGSTQKETYESGVNGQSPASHRDKPMMGGVEGRSCDNLLGLRFRSQEMQNRVRMSVRLRILFLFYLYILC